MTPIRRPPGRISASSAIVHLGPRGYGDGPDRTTRCIDMGEVSARGLDVCLGVVDPASAPEVSRPEPGGLTARQLLDAVRRAAREPPLVAVHVVGVPDGPPGPTPLPANRVVLEAVSGITRRRQEAEQADL